MSGLDGKAIADELGKLIAERDALKVEVERLMDDNLKFALWADPIGVLREKLKKAEAEVKRLRTENEALSGAVELITDEADEQKARAEKAEAERIQETDAANILLKRNSELEAELEASRAVILSAYDELLNESWECPRCGEPQPTADMDVMLLLLKPAALRYRENAALKAKGQEGK